MSAEENTASTGGFLEETQQRRKTIMIVDDESSVRNALAEILEDEGYQAVVVRNGREALSYLHECSELPCLILLDMLMPELSGVEFLSRLHEEPALAEIPVVTMSGSFYLAQETHVLGATDYLLKPFDITELLTTVTRVCSRGSITPGLNGAA